jgi:hypothetical protein
MSKFIEILETSEKGADWSCMADISDCALELDTNGVKIT